MFFRDTMYLYKTDGSYTTPTLAGVSGCGILQLDNNRKTQWMSRR